MTRTSFIKRPERGKEVVITFELIVFCGLGLLLSSNEIQFLLCGFEAALRGNFWWGPSDGVRSVRGSVMMN